ncbi:MAG: putative HTH-type transcriptional regulator [Chlamydiae bacterium]|nr:putative HTH-type transcriptional regulator [Chlamydiota bacterium]
MKKSINFKEISIHDTPDRSPGFLLWHVSTAWRGSIEEMLKSMGLTHPQFVILATLGWLTRKGDRVTQALIGKMAGLDPNTVSQIIRGLEQKELIMREKSSDGRAKNPSLTAKGSNILKKAMPAVETKDAEFFHKLTVKERECMMNIFQKLVPMNTEITECKKTLM